MLYLMRLLSLNIVNTVSSLSLTVMGHRHQVVAEVQLLTDSDSSDQVISIHGIKQR